MQVFSALFGLWIARFIFFRVHYCACSMARCRRGVVKEGVSSVSIANWIATRLPMLLRVKRWERCFNRRIGVPQVVRVIILFFYKRIIWFLRLWKSCQGAAYLLLKLTWLSQFLTFISPVPDSLFWFWCFSVGLGSCHGSFFIEQFWSKFARISRVCRDIRDDSHHDLSAKARGFLLLTVKHFMRSFVCIELHDIRKKVKFAHTMQRVAIELDWVEDLFLGQLATSAVVVPL